ncbi:hypothetical protein COS86_07535, partial [Candidatus Bathyarchaeota archaeon CG07_land_8_20_14_0_80_47_9]
MSESIQITAEKIKRLEIQGARNIAIAAIKAVEVLARQTKARSKRDFLKELLSAKEILFAARETEPLMRNAVRWMINQAEKSRETSVQKLARTVSLSSQRFLE